MLAAATATALRIWGERGTETLTGLVLIGLIMRFRRVQRKGVGSPNMLFESPASSLKSFQFPGSYARCDYGIHNFFTAC